MKVVDAPRWRATKAELCADETGEQLLAFIEHWCGNAEHILARKQDYDYAGAVWIEATRQSQLTSEDDYGDMSLADYVQLASKRHNGASGRRLAEIAVAHGYDVSHTTMNRIRKGTYKSDPTTSTLRAIAHLAGVSEDRVFKAAANGRESVWTPLEALRQALEITEHQLAVYWSAHMVGQALVAVCANWEHGEGLYAGMTPLERRIVQTAAEMILEEQQRGAQALSDQTSV